MARKLSKSTRATGLRELRATGRNASGYPANGGTFLTQRGNLAPVRGNGQGTTKSHRRPDGRAARSRAASARRNCRRRAIETTLAELAHEIRTPLTGILALGELLATAGLPPREREWAMAIKSTGEHLTMLTSLIVDAVRADASGLVLRRDLIRPRAFAQSLAASLDARAQSKDIACEVTIAPDLPEVGDRRRACGCAPRSKT